MELVAEYSHLDQSSTMRRAKSRSKACLHCRRRKMRCDGVKPSCFQCVRAERANECEYDDGITKSSTQALYERLAMLEKRYRDLQATKRPSRNRRSPSYSRTNVGTSAQAKGSVTNLVRSNSAPERVHSLPGVNDTAFYDEGQFGVSVIPHGTSNSFSFGDFGPGLSAIAAVDGGLLTPNIHPFDANSPSWSSHSSPHSGRSTPSTSEFSHNEMAFHPKYAFTYDVQQGLSSHLPYNVSNTEITTSLWNGLDTPPPAIQNISGYPDIPRPFSRGSSHEIDVDDSITPAMLEHLMDYFIAHSQQAGLTILSTQVTDLLRFTTNYLTSEMSCITNCFLLWGAQFSPVKSLNARKQQFLRNTLAALPSLISSPLAIAPELKCSSDISGATGSDHANDERYNVVIAIVISTMLATYFFAEGRTIEGSYHASTASRLAICAGLHHTPDPRLWRDQLCEAAAPHINGAEGMRSNYQHPRTTNSGTDLIPPPVSLRTALERHTIFWNIFVLDRAWSAAGRLPASSSQWSAVASDPSKPDDLLKDKDPRTAAATPWPEDWGLLLIEEPRGNTSTLSVTAGPPVENFLTGVDVSPTESILQLRAKSAALFEAASRIASLWNPYKFQPGYESSFTSLQRTLSNFLKTLPPLSQHDFGPLSFARSSQYTTHTLVHAAVIRLYSRLSEKAYKDGIVGDSTALFSHGRLSAENVVQRVVDGLLGYERVFSQNEPGDVNAYSARSDHSPGGSAGMAYAAVDRCLSSAREIVRIAKCIAPDDFSFLEPIIAPCWSLAGEVLVRELKRLPTGHQSSGRIDLLCEIRALEISLKHLGGIFPIGNMEARRVSTAVANALGNSASEKA